MAIPTLTACAPSAIFTGGSLVTLTGSNFRLAYPVAAAGVVPTPPPTVSVSFGGVAATRVCVFSATELTCIAPAFDPPSTPGTKIAIVLKNLDINGAPISGETVTASTLAGYARADLSVEADFTRMTRALLKLLKQQVIANVVQTTSVDYSDAAGDLSFELVNTAALPCVVVMRPTTKWDPAYEGELTPETTTTTDNYDQRRFMKTVAITWKVQGFDNVDSRALNLEALVNQVFSLNDWLYVDIDPADLSKGQVRYELIASDFGATGTANNSDVRSFAGEVTVRGFTFEDVAGMPGTMLSRKGGAVTSDPDLTFEGI